MQPKNAERGGGKLREDWTGADARKRDNAGGACEKDVCNEDVPEPAPDRRAGDKGRRGTLP